MAFALCYVAAQTVFDLVNEGKAGEVLHYCEEHLKG
jgi:hypothetical protein